jgi:hypothetical protein
METYPTHELAVKAADRVAAISSFKPQITPTLTPLPTPTPTPLPQFTPTPVPQLVTKETPLPTPTPTPKPRKMGTGTKIALGVGAAALLGGGIALAVSGGDEDSEPTVSGRWSGLLMGFVTVSLNLSQNRSSITGSGSILAYNETFPLQVTGTNNYPNVTLTLNSVGYHPMTFTGQFYDKNTISGVINGSGFIDEPITFIREQ